MVKLNLGCGNDYREGFVNVDIRPLGDVVANVCNLPIKDDSVDAINAVDIYEHISFTKSKELLKHWVSKLKKGGKLFIQAPSIDRIIDFYKTVTDVAGLEKVIECLFGKQDYEENTHFTICHPKLMDSYLRQAGITGPIQFQLENTNVRFRAVK